MIDWTETTATYGYRNQDDLVAKRPKVICSCDGCGKKRSITVRVKARIINGQMPWRCPSCVCLGRSGDISVKMKECWSTADYRSSQLIHKADADYKELQARKSRERWADSEYRGKLETGIDADAYISKCDESFPGQFSYDRSSFTNWHGKISITCLACNTVFERLPLGHIQAGSCPACKLPGKLRDLFPSGYTLNDRITIAPLELDVYWPKRRVAIEYHGVYWHSYGAPEQPAEKFRHQTKALKSIDKNIRLFQFFDYEWISQELIVTSIVNNLFGRSEQIGARKLDVVHLDTKKSSDFFIKNHLQGYRCASTTMGLYSRSHDEILMAMSFAKHNDGFEIIRMATKTGHQVIGGASRLLSHFRRNKPIYTFADLRYSTGATYQALGFKKISITKPNYFYYKSNVFLSRQQCQKHKLVRLLDDFNPAMSESENMFANGFRRVWDAGHLKLVL